MGGFVLLIIVAAPFIIYCLIFNVLLRDEGVFANHAWPHFFASCLLFDIALLLAWTIPCSIWIYGVSPSHGDKQDDDYCDYATYTVAFASVTILNTTLGLVLTIVFIILLDCVGLCCHCGKK